LQAIKDRKARLNKVFELCDTNGDGVLEERDFEVPYEVLARERGRGKGEGCGRAKVREQRVHPSSGRLSARSGAE